MMLDRKVLGLLSECLFLNWWSVSRERVHVQGAGSFSMFFLDFRCFLIYHRLIQIKLKSSEQHPIRNGCVYHEWIKELDTHTDD